MRDGHTRKRERHEPPSPTPEFLREQRAFLVVESGPAAGTEFDLPDVAQVMGRGDHCALHFADDAMSREHASIELADEGFRIRDLASTNGVVRNGEHVLAAHLEHGDRLEIGTYVFRFIVEPRSTKPLEWVIKED